jgi:hypothetical protein
LASDATATMCSTFISAVGYCGVFSAVGRRSEPKSNFK